MHTSKFRATPGRPSTTRRPLKTGRSLKTGRPSSSALSRIHAALAEALEERRLFAGGLPGIPLVAAIGGLPSAPTAALATVNFRYPSTDVHVTGPVLNEANTDYLQIANPDGSYAGLNSPGSGAMTPQQMRTAYYGANTFVYGGVTGTGAGQTIALIDAYGDPSFVNSTDPNFAHSDLHVFDQQFGLPDPPSFTKYSQSGSTSSYPGYNSGWATETALDVEWSHSMAPGASIILVEANSQAMSDLDAAVNLAKSLGASAVSMSYGLGEVSEDPTFVNAANQPVTAFAATGDSGSAGGVTFPSDSANVVAVGGTTLNSGLINSGFAGTWTTETGWTNGGGGVSSTIAKPSFQNLVTTPSSTARTVPDVAADADANTGVSVLDTSSTVNSNGLGTTPNPNWSQYGGTSLSTPMWAGMLAVVDQFRATVGLSKLSGSPLAGYSQLLPRLYELPASAFHDITSGSNGAYSAGVGYDLVTGLGTPKLATLIPDLAGGVTLSGTVFDDNNGDSSYDAGDTGIAGAVVYIDIAKTGSYQSGDPVATTTATGSFSFPDQVAGATFTIRLASVPSGYFSTTGTSATATGVFNQTISNINFGFFPSALTGSAFTVQNAPGGTSLQIFTSAAATGSPTYSIAKTQLPTFPFSGASSGANIFNVDLTNGNPLSGVTLSYNGSATASSNTVAVTGTTTLNTVSYSSSATTIDGIALSYSTVQARAYIGGGGGDTIGVNATTVTFSGTPILSSLTLSGPAKAILAPGDRTLLTHSLATTAAATLDLTDGKLLYEYTGASPITTDYGYVSTAYSGGTWAGKGITSSAAATNSLAGLGIAEASALLGLTSGQTGTFDGSTVTATTLIIKYTYKGDTDLNGQINGADIANALAGLNGALTGWANGDTDYNKTVNATDYATLLNTFRLQGPPIP